MERGFFGFEVAFVFTDEVVRLGLESGERGLEGGGCGAFALDFRDEFFNVLGEGVLVGLVGC